MKNLRISATITAILGFLSLTALVLMFLALSDISKEPDTVLEWKVVKVCYMELILFLFLSLFTIGFIIKVPGIWKDNSLK